MPCHDLNNVVWKIGFNFKAGLARKRGMPPSYGQRRKQSGVRWGGRSRTGAHLAGIAVFCAISLPALADARAEPGADLAASGSWKIPSRIVALNLPKAYGVRQVGRFHSGGPFTTNPEFLMQTQAGRVLDPERVLVAVASNLGARPANPKEAAGAVLSIDTKVSADGRPLSVPADFAVQPGQGRKKAAPVQIYTLQSEQYLNRRNNPQARTAHSTAVSGPRYLSINNAFGRPWIANAPFGLHGDGSESVVDPDGTPLANAPSDSAGGVFAGTATARESMTKGVRSGLWAAAFNYRRSRQMTAGAISRGALGTAFLGPSPDGSGFAVFAVITGDGAVAQVHVQDGVDGLAPPGTITVGAADPGVIGVTFKWGPRRVLYVADAQRNRIARLHLTDDTRHFKLERVSHIESTLLRHPVDLVAAIPELASPHFASHTTLSGGSDFYIANRGDGSLLRLSQDGKIIARAEIEIAGSGLIGADRLRSIAVSADAQKLWLIVDSGANNSALLEVAAFDENGPFMQASQASIPGKHSGTLARHGDAIFSAVFSEHNGLGPRFNANSCVACHPGPGGASPREEHFVRRLAHMDPVSGRLRPMNGTNSQLAPRFLASTPAQRGAQVPPLPRQANVISMRMPLALFAVGKIDDIPDAVIEAQAISKGDGIKGRVHYVNDADGTRRVGRYGWKGDVATLNTMVAQAFFNELGITSALAPRMQNAAVEDDGTMVRSISAFLSALPRPSAAR